MSRQTMQMQPVTSSNIAKIGYDPAAVELHVEFKGGKRWKYPGVPPEKHDEMMASESVGSYFAREIKPAFDGVQIPEEPAACTVETIVTIL